MDRDDDLVRGVPLLVLTRLDHNGWRGRAHMVVLCVELVLGLLGDRRGRRGELDERGRRGRVRVRMGRG